MKSGLSKVNDTDLYQAKLGFTGTAEVGYKPGKDF